MAAQEGACLFLSNYGEKVDRGRAERKRGKKVGGEEGREAVVQI